ncbi:MAG TPA: YceH family protein [Gaiellaceae bacterium]
MDADAVEIRVLGCLIEKQRTTPDAYPLSLNSLRLACNQATNRDPVVAYEEREIKAALERMSNRGWTRFASGASSRALKYRHLLDEALQLSGPELSLLGVLMLRGAQTVGELKQRSERLHRFESIAEVAETLDVLSQRELVERLERRPGQKEERWVQLLGGVTEYAVAEPESPTPQPRGDDRVAEIEARLERLEQAFDDLLARVDRVPDRE